MYIITAYLIDPELRVVAPVEVDPSSLSGIRAAIAADTIAAISLPDGGCIYVDDEGLLSPQRHFWTLAGRDFPCAGRGLWLGPEMWVGPDTETDGDSQHVAPTLSIERASALVTFLNARTATAVFNRAHERLLHEAQRQQAAGIDVCVAHSGLEYDPTTDTARMV